MFWIFTFFGNSDSAVHSHPYVNFFILSLTLSLSSHLFSSPLLSPHFPIHPTHPSSLTLLLFKYPPTLHSRYSSHIIHSFPPIPTLHLSTTYPQLIHSFSTSFPQPLSYSSTSHPPLYPHLYCYFSNHPHYNSYSIPIQSYPQVH